MKYLLLVFFIFITSNSFTAKLIWMLEARISFIEHIKLMIRVYLLILTLISSYFINKILGSGNKRQKLSSNIRNK